jgi:hypothetical protein
MNIEQVAQSIEKGVRSVATGEARILRGIDLAAKEVVRLMNERHEELTGWEMKSHIQAIATLSMTDAVQRIISKYGDQMQVERWADAAWLALASKMFKDADEIFAVKTLNAHRLVQKRLDDQQAGIQAAQALEIIEHGHAPTTKHAGMHEGRSLDAAGAMIEIERREHAGRQFPAKRRK